MPADMANAGTITSILVNFERRYETIISAALGLPPGVCSMSVSPLEGSMPWMQAMKPFRSSGVIMMLSAGSRGLCRNEDPYMITLRPPRKLPTSSRTPADRNSTTQTGPHRLLVQQTSQVVRSKRASVAPTGSAERDREWLRCKGGI